MILAYLRRDLSIERSYRAALAGHLLGGLLFVASFAVVAPVVRDDFAARHGSGYASWAAVGIAVTGLLLSAVQSMSTAVRQAQLEGTLEVQLLAPVTPQRVVSAMGAFPLTVGAGATALTLAVAAASTGAFDVDPLTLLLAATGSVAAFAGLGLASAAAVVVARRGDPVALALAMVGGLSAGAYAPVDTLPGPLQAVAAVNPLTHALEAWRAGLLDGAGPGTVAPALAVLAATAAVALPAGWWLLGRAVGIARSEGLLAGY